MHISDHRRGARWLSVLALVVLSLVTSGAGASAAPAWVGADDQPCGAPFVIPDLDPPGLEPNDVQVCPDWSPDGRIPVYSQAQVGNGSEVIGHVNAAGDDWYLCRTQGGQHRLDEFETNWWAFTKADGNGRFGYVPQTYFRGGGNFESDAGLTDTCLGF